jgi:hypothetical protein
MEEYTTDSELDSYTDETNNETNNETSDDSNYDVESIIKLSEQEMMGKIDSFPHREHRWFERIRDNLTTMIDERVAKLPENRRIDIMTGHCFFDFNRSFNRWTSMGGYLSNMDKECVVKCLSINMFLGGSLGISEVEVSTGFSIETLQINCFEHPVFDEISTFLSNVEDLVAKDPSEYVEKLTIFCEGLRTEFEIVKHENWKNETFLEAYQMKYKDVVYLRDMIVKTFRLEKHYMENVLPAEEKRMETMMEAFHIQ